MLWASQANTGHSTNVVSMVAHCLWRWSSIETVLSVCQADQLRKPCRAKRRYLLTFQVSRCCLLTSQDRVHTESAQGTRIYLLPNKTHQCWLNVGQASQPMCQCKATATLTQCVVFVGVMCTPAGGGGSVHRPEGARGVTGGCMYWYIHPPVTPPGP